MLFVKGFDAVEFVVHGASGAVVVGDDAAVGVDDGERTNLVGAGAASSVGVLDFRRGGDIDGTIV